MCTCTCTNASTCVCVCVLLRLFCIDLSKERHHNELTRKNMLREMERKVAYKYCIMYMYM